MDVRVRDAVTADIPALARMIDALDRHYRGDRVPGLALTEDMLRRCFAMGEGTRFALAEIPSAYGMEPAGLAAYVILRPGHATRGLIFVKDLFVRAEHRGGGVGEAVMGYLGRMADRQGIGRVELITSEDNAAACRFYDRLGGKAAPRIMYRFEPDALAALGHGRNRALPAD